jgi:hypothetical protein
MRQTVLGVYDNYADACSAQRALGEAGVAPADIAVYSMSVAAPVEKGPRVYAPGSGGVQHRIPVFDQLDQLFAQLFKQGEYPPETEDYKEFVRRGGAVVSADVPEMQVDLARDVMRRAGAADIDERSRAWWAEPAQAATPEGAQPDSSAAVRAPSRQYGPAVAPNTVGGMQQVTTRPQATQSRPPIERQQQTSAKGLVGDPVMGTPLDDEISRDESPKDYDADDMKTGAPDGLYRRAYLPRTTPLYDERNRRQASGWDRFKAAVRHGWERVTRH